MTIQKSVTNENHISMKHCVRLLIDSVKWIAELHYTSRVLLIFYADTLTKPYVAHYEVPNVKWNKHNDHKKHHIENKVPMEITRTANKIYLFSTYLN